MKISYGPSNGKAIDRVESFWMKVHKKSDNECWEWTASVGSPGYGQLWMGDTYIGAHRFSYELHIGKIPDGLWVLHKCDNRKCVNPNHLFLGTQQDNETDKVSKGRQASGRKNGQGGTKNWKNKLSEQDVYSIRNSDRPYFELSKTYSITENMVYLIKSRRSWKWLP